MNEGRIIEYIERGKLICTLCLQDKGSRLHLLTPSNREVNLSPKRALLVSSASMNTQRPREELLTRLRDTEELRNSLKGQVQVKELWELVRDEEEGFDYIYLAQLCFGEPVSDDHISALVRALFEHGLYFKMRDSRFVPHSGDKVEEIIRQREEEARREEILKQGGAWLKEVLQGDVAHEPRCKEDIAALLIEMALYGSDAANFKHGKELLSRAGISDIQQSRTMLIKLGVWDEDENLDLHRLDIRTSFSEDHLNESSRMAKVGIEQTGREDLRDLKTLTIDGPLTRDFDDALSMEIVNDSIILGVHIADVAGVIPPDSIIDKEASHRGASLYLPRLQVPMIPTDLSQEALSLKQGCDRPTISLLSRFDKSGNLLDYRFVPGLVKVQRQLTYDQVNEIYMKEGPLEQMYQLSQLMHRKRIEQGALILSLPEVSVEIHPDSAVTLGLIDQDTPSRMMVAEFMILYNWLAAKFCTDNKIPILYRGQEEPNERLLIDEAGYLYYVFKQRRKLHPLVIDTEPRPHKGLGLDAYTNVSSPIRRYLDLVIQRQIRSFLLGKSPAYDKEALDKVRISVSPVLKELEAVKRNRVRYWTQKYLLQHKGETFPALILDIMKTRYRILLVDFLLVTEMKREEGQGFTEGQRITVRVKKSDPWNDLLGVEYAGQ